MIQEICYHKVLFKIFKIAYFNVLEDCDEKFIN